MRDLQIGIGLSLLERLLKYTYNFTGLKNVVINLIKISNKGLENGQNQLHRGSQ
jgi:hypothetical protein